MFLSKISIHLGIMILYTIENFFFFCRCTLQAFSTEEIWKRHIKDSFEINGKQNIIIPKNLCHFTFHHLEFK